MKIAVTAQGKDLDSAVDPRFGRAKYFILVDTKNWEFSAADNQVNLNAVQGAGIQAGRNVVELCVQVVITGHVGHKAFATLQAGGVEVYNGASGSVAHAIEQYQNGKLQLTNKADVEGHWV